MPEKADTLKVWDPARGRRKRLLGPDSRVSLIHAQVTFHLLHLLSIPLMFKYVNQSLSNQNFEVSFCIRTKQIKNTQYLLTFGDTGYTGILCTIFLNFSGNLK